MNAELGIGTVATMRHLTTTLAATVAATALIPALAAAPAGAATPRPPVVRETFTALPCGGAPAHRSTIQMEGCAERQILARDRTINRLNASVFASLSTISAKRVFIASNTHWLRYRNAFCTTAASRFAGGTEQPVVVAQCIARLDAGHIADLRTLRAPN
jgi:uncharacterized protein YecT (DUF1311 family)